MKNLIIRALSGAVYIALVISSIYFGGWLFATFFGILVIIGMHEAQKLAWKGKCSTTLQVRDIATGMALFLGAFASVAFGTDPRLAAPLPILLVLARFIAGLYLKEQSPIASWANSCFTICYVAVPLTTLALILHTYGMLIALFMFVCIWLNDTGAYLVGCTIGKHRLFERISPKKSWEGFFGGFVLCIAAGAAANLYFTEESWLQWAVLGAVVSIAATLGDLIESLIKRTVGVKDSGNIMPGHGGILDRIDSLLLVAPATLVYLLFLNLL